MKFSFYIVLLLFCLSGFAQTTLTGRIIGQADTKPVPNASVFLNNATIGTKTAEDGTFNLKSVKPGKYQLIVSCIGFENYNQPITVNEDKLDLHDITIFPKTITLNEVKIKPQGDTYREVREVNYNLFKQYFLGTSVFAESCDILNPDILDLDFDDNTKTLTAYSGDFLIIRNNALGYKISYLLKNFTLNRSANEIHYDGSVLFEPLVGSASQEKRWQKNREDVYQNSSMHFFRSVIKNQFAGEGFQVQLVTGNGQEVQKLISTPLSRENFFKPGAQRNIYDLFCSSGYLFISYSKNHRFNLKTSLTRINDPTNKTSTLVASNSPNPLFDANGVLLDPGSLVFSGAWGNNRVAELLPSDYEPPVSSVTSADTSVLKGIEGKLEAYAANRPVEKVYLHLDKPVYFPGDTLWFKAYTVTAAHRLSTISGVLYVELIDPRDSVVSRRTLSLYAGTSSGDFVLPVKPRPGSYSIRAYTNWMRNGQAADIYQQKLLIAGLAPATTAQQPTGKLPDVQFFPEGGDLIEGIRSKVAVKSVNRDGLGEDVSGSIVDNDGAVAAEFKTQHLGMGVFAFTPQHGKTYTAKITGVGNTDFTVGLPKAREVGYTLAVNNSQQDSVYIKISANDALFKFRQNSAFYVVAQSGGKIYYTSAGKLTAPVFSLAVEKSRFPSGISQFTLFSAGGEPLNERIAFIQQDDTLKLKLSDTGQRSSRGMNKIGLTAADNENKPAVGTFSVSVINESLVKFNEVDENTIFTNLLLTSELKGYIENPNYYFFGPNDQTKADLDVLMLTQGYRRYEWKHMADDNNRAVTFQPEKFLSIKGLVQTSPGKPVVNKKISMAVTRLRLFADTTTDNNGNFEFTGLDLPDSSKVLFNAGENTVVKIRSYGYLPVPDQPSVSSSPQLSKLHNHNNNNYLQLTQNDSLKRGRMLKEVTVKEKRIPAGPDLTGSANLNGPGHADQVILSDQLNDCINLADCLNGKLSFVYVINGVFYSIRDQNSININSMAKVLPSMKIIVDGQVMDSSYINTVAPKDVASVEVLLSGAYLAIYGSNAPFGAIVITTKRGVNINTDDMVTNLAKYTFNGFSKTRTFYSPKYEHAQTAMGVKDLRTTQYWNPYLITGRDGKASFNYFNSDAKGIYRVVVEGIDINGNLGRAVWRYVVE